MNINLRNLRPAAIIPRRAEGGPVTPVSTTLSLHADAPRITRPFLTIMAIVAGLAALYYGLIAAPMYVSEAQFSIRGQQPAIPSTLLAGLVGKDGGSVTDMGAVEAYIGSPSMLAELDKRFDLRRAYSRFRPDLFHWMPRDASDERFLKFYRRMVIVKLKREAEIVEVDVRSFDQASARPMAEFILQRTEAFVDGMTLRMRNETMRSAEQELAAAQKEADAARAAIAGFRGATASVDPRGVGMATQGGEAALEAQAAAAQAELAGLLTVNTPDSPAVKQVRAKIAAIRGQAARLKAEQAGATGLSRNVTTFEVLEVQREGAERKLAAALTAKDSARALAQQREKYVVRIVNPTAPDRPALPRRFMDFLMVIVFALAGYAILTLTIAGIRDHRGV